jgi:hypothetical protein
VVLAVTVSWVPRPVTPVTLRLKMGPAGIHPDKVYGLRFTTFNNLSGHVVKQWAPDASRCVPVVITNSRLTYIAQRQACILYDGSFKLPYAFPGYDDYILFITFHPLLGAPETHRFTIPLDYCAFMTPDQLRHTCIAPRALLRGQEAVRSHIVDGLTVVLGAPAHAITAGSPTQVSFVFLRRGRAVPDLQPISSDVAGDAVAVSMDTMYVALLRAAPNQVTKGHISGGAVSFTAQFSQPGIYRIFATFRYRQRPLHTSFVVDVNPQPAPTPIPTPD